MEGAQHRFGAALHYLAKENLGSVLGTMKSQDYQGMLE